MIHTVTEEFPCPTRSHTHFTIQPHMETPPVTVPHNPTKTPGVPQSCTQSHTLPQSWAQTPRHSHTHTLTDRWADSPLPLPLLKGKETLFSALPHFLWAPTLHPCPGLEPPSPPTLPGPRPKLPTPTIASAAASCLSSGEQRLLGSGQGLPEPSAPSPRGPASLPPCSGLPLPSAPHCSLLCPSFWPPRPCGTGVEGDRNAGWNEGGGRAPSEAPLECTPSPLRSPCTAVYKFQAALGARPDSPSQVLLSPIWGPDAEPRAHTGPGPACPARPPRWVSCLSVSLPRPLNLCPSLTLCVSLCLS